MDSRYFGIKNECCKDDNITETSVAGMYQCRTCKRIFELTSDSIRSITKKNLENKIEELEVKLSELSKQVGRREPKFPADKEWAEKTLDQFHSQREELFGNRFSYNTSYQRGKMDLEKMEKDYEDRLKKRIVKHTGTLPKGFGLTTEESKKAKELQELFNRGTMPKGWAEEMWKTQRKVGKKAKGMTFKEKLLLKLKLAKIKEAEPPKKNTGLPKGF